MLDDEKLKFECNRMKKQYYESLIINNLHNQKKEKAKRANFSFPVCLPLVAEVKPGMLMLTGISHQATKAQSVHQQTQVAPHIQDLQHIARRENGLSEWV